ncbi:MAG: ferritin [Verrucomicrobiota bacterium]
MPGIAIKPMVATEIQRQLNHELGAAQGYLAMALWCDHEHYSGFAAFFHKQVEEERAHAAKFMAHLLDRGVRPEIRVLAAPKSEYATLFDVVKQAQAMERVNTEGVNATYEAALASKDYPAQVLLQWFIQEQVEEEAWADELLDRVQSATCAGSMMDLDRHLDKILGADKK